MAIVYLATICPSCNAALEIPRPVILETYRRIMTHTRIPEDELKVFKSLPDVKVVFDVGAREDVDYLVIKPGIELHAFEPGKTLFDELKHNVGDTKNVYLNNFACGSVEGTYKYDEAMQTVRAKIENPDDPKPGEIPGEYEKWVEVKRLDNYIKEHNIKQIDFLKIDTEGYEPQIIEGLGDMVKICRYIQYEQGKNGEELRNDSKLEFDKLVSEDDFDLYYTGYRNVLAVRKGEPMPWIPEQTQEGGTAEKDKTNYLQ